MKSFIFLLLICFFVQANAQEREYPVCLNRTTALVFKDDIIQADLGTDYGIGFQKDDTLPNLLKIRINDSFLTIKETSLIVATRNGCIFSFLLRQQNNMTQNVFQIYDSVADYKCPPSVKPAPPEFSVPLLEKLIDQKEYLPRILNEKKGSVVLLLKNIYTDSQRLYFCCELTNNSNLRYNIGFCNLFLSTKKKLKATSRQELPVKYSFVGPQPTDVAAKSMVKFVISTSKFNLEETQVCILEIYEQNGGRHFHLKISNPILLAAHLIPQTR